MRDWYKRLGIALTIFLSLIATVSAEGTSIILDNDQTTQISGSAFVMISVAVVVFAALIIVKILLMNKGD
jgi:hypothetical protein